MFVWGFGFLPKKMEAGHSMNGGTLGSRDLLAKQKAVNGY